MLYAGFLLCMEAAVTLSSIRLSDQHLSHALLQLIETADGRHMPEHNTNSTGMANIACSAHT